MKALLFALALAAPVSSAADPDGSDDRRVACSLDVHALDSQGEPRSARRVSASVAPAVIFRGKLSSSGRDEAALPLLFDVFNPRGQRYQILVARPRVVVQARGGHRVERTSRVREASLAVAGSSIALTSMYGKWRVEPRIEGTEEPCGRPEFFTIRP